MTPTLETSHGRRVLWQMMVRARAFDQAMCASNNHWHEARGEEAVFVGGFAGLRDDDVVAPHFRGACAVAMMRGESADALAASVFGTHGSLSGGNWRGDICPSPGPRSIGMFSGSLGTTVAYAAGAALHLKNRGAGAVAVSAFGDGTANAGIVSESMNMAAMLELPLVLICQNNQYATSLPASKAIAGGQISRRAKGFGIPAIDVDGNDLRAVFEARDEAVEHARSGRGPMLIHALTYRLGGHYMNDPETYRSADEVAEWGRLDPLDRYADALIENRELTHEQAQLDLEVETNKMSEIVVAAKNADTPGGPLGRSPYAEDWKWAV